MLASGLPAGEHLVELYRRTEANQGESQFLGFDFGEGALLAPPPRAERRIELVGDSITAGYGNEGADMSCPFSPDTENHYLTYGALAARQLGAEASTVAECLERNQPTPVTSARVPGAARSASIARAIECSV